ncbi:MAG TPA: molybdate ABC transporter substrate-binding protein [Thermoleophilaceae bacterium]|nr:molybdate ABC transporter substrate-binding protein [Thermoleophilaceae bacterium]
MRRAALLLAAALVAAGCGGGEPGPRVAAASSLEPAFEALAARAGDPAPRFSFAGSDALAAQIRRGARPDLFAAASADLPAALHAEGLVERPVEFAANELVVAVASRSPIRSLEDLRGPGVTVVWGSGRVPVGAYARSALRRLRGPLARDIEAAVRSEEPDAASIAGKLEAGAADAGFVYASDVRASGGALRAVRLPARARPEVRYSAAVVAGAPGTERGRAFLRALTGPDGDAALRAAGLRPVRR